MSRLPLKAILLLIGVPGFCLAVVLLGSMVWAAAQERAALQRVPTAIAQAQIFSALIHELQKERGTSVGWLTGDGNPEALERVRAVRALSDGLLPQALEALASAETASPDLIGGLRAISALRGKVDERALAAGEAAVQYTALVEGLIAEINGRVMSIPAGEIAGTAKAMLALIKAKEHGGLERAFGAGLLNLAKQSGAVPHGLFLKYHARLSREAQMLTEFRGVASADQQALFDATVKGPDVVRVAEMRTILTALPETPNVDTMSGADWFALATRRLDLLKTVEDALGQQARSQAQTAIAAATTLVAVEVGLGAVAFAALGLLLFAAMRCLNRIITALSGRVDSLANGDLTSPLPATDRDDAFGVIARSLQTFRDALAQAEQHRQAQREREAVQAARTAHMEKLQQRLDALAQAASAGDFSQRIDASDLEEDLARLAEALNAMVSRVEQGLGEVGSVVEALSNADLTARMNTDLGGAFATLQNRVNGMALELTQLLAAIQSTSGTVKGSCNELSAGANDLSNRTSEQAATVEQTLSSMELLSQTVQANAEMSAKARKHAVEARDQMDHGQQVMSKAQKAMEGILATSDKIASIITMIDTIAFQTNLLALNASVEAARAGEAGSGFAVVAGEVRRLAQSTAEASTQVKGLIDASMQEVSGGSALVVEAATGLSEIVTAFADLQALLDQVAQAGDQQAQSITDMTAAMRTIDDITQQNAALVEETNRTVFSTLDQAQDLDRTVARFRTA